MLIDYTLGQTSIVLRVKIRQDNTGAKPGQGMTGLSSASTGLIVSTIADNEASTTVYTVAASHIQTITTLGTFSAPSASSCRFKEVDATNNPGVYEVQIADARFAVTSAKSILISASGVSGMADCDVVVPLRTINPYDVNFALQGLKGTTNPTAGAILTQGSGTAQINTDGSGNVPANTTKLAGQTVTAGAGVTFPASIASPTNITAGTITTVTNLTNAPTAGDFTSTMKTSLNAATPTVTVGAMATGTIDTSTFTYGFRQATMRARLVSTGTTTPASADFWAVAGMYSPSAGVIEPYYSGQTNGLSAWYNGTAWIISSTAGVNGSAYFTGGATVTAAYTASGTATGTPVVVAHGNATLSGFEPDITFPTNFGLLSVDPSGRTLLQPTQTGVTIPTVTTVTNQLTAAQVATGVWQDIASGDFAVAASIGKSLFTGVAPGASTGLFIAGSNAATTVNFTGNLSGSVGSVTAIVSANTTQLAGQTVTAGAGVTFPASIASPTNITSASGVSLAANQHVIVDSGTVTTVTNQLTAAQIATGVWQDSTAGDFTTASSIGKSIYNAFTANTSVYTTAALANAPTGGSAPTASAIATAVWQDATPGDFTVTASIGKSLFTGVVPGAGGGVFIAGTNAATTANFTGSLSGNVGGVTGVTFPSSVASPTNITAGTITTVTNLTNAPTSGDFTGTMKTSLNAATPTVALAANQHVIVDSGTVTNLTNAPTAGDLTSTMKASVVTAATSATPTIAGSQSFTNSTANPATLAASNVTGNVPAIVNTYASGQDPGTLVLAIPGQKILTDGSGNVSLAGTQAMPYGTVVGGSTVASVIVSGLPSGYSYVGQRLYNLTTAEARIINSQTYSGGNYTLSFGGGSGESSAFSNITTGNNVIPVP